MQQIQNFSQIQTVENAHGVKHQTTGWYTLTLLGGDKYRINQTESSAALNSLTGKGAFVCSRLGVAIAAHQIIKIEAEKAGKPFVQSQSRTQEVHKKEMERIEKVKLENPKAWESALDLAKKELDGKNYPSDKFKKSLITAKANSILRKKLAL